MRPCDLQHCSRSGFMHASFQHHTIHQQLIPSTSPHTPHNSPKISSVCTSTLSLCLNFFGEKEAFRIPFKQLHNLPWDGQIAPSFQGCAVIIKNVQKTFLYNYITCARISLEVCFLVIDLPDQIINMFLLLLLLEYLPSKKVVPVIFALCLCDISQQSRHQLRNLVLC